MATCIWIMDGGDDPKVAEAMALSKEINVALYCCFREVIFETDNLEITDMFKEVED